MECTDDLNRVCEDIGNCLGDTAIALSRIADNGQFFEVKPVRQRVLLLDLSTERRYRWCCCKRSQSYDAEGKKVWESDGTLSARGAREKQQSS